jgi:acyl-CoA synthetase (AMP-forming)/AMP-acid ligase II
MRRVFAEGDTWITTDHLFRRDSDGDYWFVDNKNTVIQLERGPVFCQPVCDALGDITRVDLAMVYSVATNTHDVAVAAVHDVVADLHVLDDLGQTKAQRSRPPCRAFQAGGQHEPAGHLENALRGDSAVDVAREPQPTAPGSASRCWPSRGVHRAGQ